MINLVVFAVVCGAVRSQSSINSYGPSKQLRNTIKDAMKGAMTLESLVYAIEETNNGPNLQDLTALLPEVFSAARSIGDLFYLTEELASGGMVFDLQSIDNQYKKLDITGGPKMYNAGRVGSKIHQNAISRTYEEVHKRLAAMHQAYSQFIQNIADNTYRSKFISACDNSSMEPAGALSNIHTVVTASDTKHGSNLMEVMRQGSKHDFGMMKWQLQSIVKDAGRAIMIRQACLGMKRKSAAARSTAAELSQKLLREIAIVLQTEVRQLVKDALKVHAQSDIDSKTYIFSGSLPYFTTDLKNFLTKKYSWLLWNVIVYELAGTPGKHRNSNVTWNTSSDHVGIIQQTTDLDNLILSYNVKYVVVAVWSEVKDYENKKSLLHNHQLQMKNKLYNNGCSSDKAPSFSKYKEYSNDLHEQVGLIFAGGPQGRFVTVLADNAVEFQICDLYVAAVLV